MPGKCFRCKTKEAGGPSSIELQHGSIVLRGFKSGMECDDCAREGIIRNFEEGAGRIISDSGGQVNVNWLVYASQKGEVKDKMTSALLAAGIFSLSALGNWDISTDHLGLNPSYATMYVYFTREQDARHFAIAEFGDTMYGWSIRQIGKVVPKSEVLSGPAEG